MGTAVLDHGVERIDLAEMRAAVQGFCAGFDADLMTATEAAEVVVELTRLERRLTAVRGRAARRVETSSIWKHAGHRTMAEWLAAKTGDPVRAGSGLLDTARKLERLPATAELMAAGEVSEAAAREIAAAVAADPGAEAGLLAVATGGQGHRVLEDEAAKVRRAAVSAEDEAARHERLRTRRFARSSTDPDGLVHLHAGFAPKDWAHVAAHWQRATDEQFRQARRQGRRERFEAYSADALLELLRSGAIARPGEADEAEAPPQARRAPKPEVMVLVDGLALKRGYRSGGERCEIIGVGPVDVAWVNRLLPEAIVHALVHDGVDVTTYASATRSVRKAVRLAVQARDRHCVVAGCRRARRTQRDHRLEHAKGGPGSVDNLNLLCEFHHNQKSRDGARLVRVGDCWHWFPPGSAEAWRSPVGAALTLWDVDALLDTS